MKCTTEQGLMARMKIHKSFTATRKLSDNGMSHKCLHWSIAQHIAMVLLVLGLGTSTTLAQIRAYVANTGDSFTASGTVSVIDTATNTVVATIPVGPIPFAPIGIAITPDGTRVYVTNAGDPFDRASGTVAVIDTATNTVVATIPVGILPEAVAITPDGTRAYVANTASGTASVIDTATNIVVATVAGLLDPLGVAITPDGTRAYVTNENGHVLIIDIATNTVVTDIGVGAVPIGIAITPDGTRAYVADEANFAVSVIDTATNTVVAYIPDLAAFGVAITPDGTRAYVAGAASNTVSVIDTATNTVVATIPVGSLPLWVAITPAPRVPTSIEQCEHGGYLKFGPPAGPFKNQGQCVSYVEHH